MKIKAWDVIFLIVLLVFVFRLFFSLQTQQFSDNDSYYDLRQIENIERAGKHITYDELSYGGREVLGFPLPLYILAFFKSLLGSYALKIMPALFISLLTVVVYLIGKRITENNLAACMAALCSGFIPIFVLKTLNSLNTISIVYPLLFLAVYLFHRMNESKAYLFSFILLAFLIPIMNATAFILAISFVVYAVLIYVENIEIEGMKKEGMLLFVMVTLLVEFALYKLAFMNIGLNVIWQNAPSGILSEFFKGTNILALMLNIGVITMIAGLFGIYFGMKNKNKEIVLLASIGITSIVLLLMKLVEFSTGLILLGITLSIISAVGFDRFMKYISITKLAGHLNVIKLSMLILIILTLVIPSMINAREVINGTLTEEDITPFIWMKNNTALSATILTDISEGNLVTEISNRKSAYDMNFIFVKNVNKRYDDLNSLFTAESEVKALDAIKRYDIDYVYLSKETKEKYGIVGLKYAVDESCFEKVFENGSGEIIKVLC